MATITKGNPFTHHEETRVSIAGREVRGGCAWCGNVPRVLYRYDNDRRTGGGAAWFCNKECRGSYFPW